MDPFWNQFGTGGTEGTSKKSGHYGDYELNEFSDKTVKKPKIRIQLEKESRF